MFAPFGRVRRPARLLAPLLAVALAASVLTAGLVAAAHAPQHVHAHLATSPSVSTLATPTRASLAAKPNIVEVLADDMRVDDLAYAPHLRRLVAAQGITMQNAFSSYPLCCPARASFYSGLLPHNHHVYSTKPPYGYRSFDDRQTLATSLKGAGYHTGFLGKYLNGYGRDAALAPQLRWRAKHPGAPARRAPRVQSQYYVPNGWDDWKGAISDVFCKPACGGLYNYFHYAYSDNGRPTASRKGAYSSDVIGRQSVTMAKRFHRNRARTGQPFLMSVNYVAPHYGRGQGSLHTKNPDGSTTTLQTPAAPKRVYRLPAIKNIHKGAGITVGGLGETDVSDKPGQFARLRPLNAGQRAIETEDTRRRAAAVYAMDRNIGRLVRQLKASGEWDRTVFVFWSDNGYFQGEHNRMTGKIHVYEPSLRVPILITGPGMRGGSHTGLFGGQDRFDPMDVVDLTHTLVDLAGARVPHTPDGKSMVAVLRGRDAGWTEAVPYEAVGNNPGGSSAGDGDRVLGVPVDKRESDTVAAGVDPRDSVGVRTSRYVYVRYRDSEIEIYDLWNDPKQWSNLAKNAGWMRANAGVVSALQAAVAELRYCAGTSCHPRLPASLSAPAATNASKTAAYWRTIAREYGWSRILRS
ncbi:sulfatase-like hydrolase/transferase [Nocardioides sp. CER19]|uniref:sulfatase-like hydrolase/transferase n=1 Tax=Nocardioides sp. CER19 TaxID=3038538 RepID=UPI002448DFCC|nr:sulfatase-like hydrolase/transferase [Nocardioides sp. CER19]MDH2413661.1 sulfatase-like hydrolase/transferase [Nocardioides sp. CER19]